MNLRVLMAAMARGQAIAAAQEQEEQEAQRAFLQKQLLSQQEQQGRLSLEQYRQTGQDRRQRAGFTHAEDLAKQNQTFEAGQNSLYRANPLAVAGFNHLSRMDEKDADYDRELEAKAIQLGTAISNATGYDTSVTIPQMLSMLKMGRSRTAPGIPLPGGEGNRMVSSPPVSFSNSPPAAPPPTVFTSNGALLPDERAAAPPGLPPVPPSPLYSPKFTETMADNKARRDARDREIKVSEARLTEYLRSNKKAEAQRERDYLNDLRHQKEMEDQGRERNVISRENAETNRNLGQRRVGLDERRIGLDEQRLGFEATRVGQAQQRLDLDVERAARDLQPGFDKKTGLSPNETSRLKGLQSERNRLEAILQKEAYKKPEERDDAYDLVAISNRIEAIKKEERRFYSVGKGRSQPNQTAPASLPFGVVPGGSPLPTIALPPNFGNQRIISNRAPIPPPKRKSTPKKSVKRDVGF